MPAFVGDNDSAKNFFANVIIYFSGKKEQRSNLVLGNRTVTRQDILQRFLPNKKNKMKETDDHSQAYPISVSHDRWK